MTISEDLVEYIHLLEKHIIVHFAQMRSTGDIYDHVILH